jgi:hypothetical protein
MESSTQQVRRYNSIHRQQLFYWTGRNLDLPSANRTAAQRLSQRVAYVDRLRSLIADGIWLKVPDKPDQLGDGKLLKVSRPIACFSEWSLGQSIAHTSEYGRLGLGFSKQFILSRGGQPVIYVRDAKTNSQYVSALKAIARVLKNETSGIPDYVLFALRTQALRREIEIRASGTSGSMKNISKEDAAALRLPVPPLAQQRHFASLVAQHEHLRANQCEALRQAEHHFQSLLRRAFSGELTAGAEVIELQSSPEFIRTVLAAEIVDRMHGDRTFGQVKLQKVIHLVEYIVLIEEIASEPERFAAGPHDPKLIAQVEAKMKDCDWFEVVPRADGYGNEYRPLASAGGHREHFEKLWPKQAAAIRRLIDEMKSWKTERCERFATVYAAWNDLLHWEKPVTDSAILEEVLEHWHPDKLQIPKAKWVETLGWMRDEGYIPSRFGHPTAPKPQPELFSAGSP